MGECRTSVGCGGDKNELCYVQPAGTGSISHRRSLMFINFYIARPAYHFIVVYNCGLTRYDTRCYFNVRSKADMSQLNLPHGTDN